LDEGEQQAVEAEREACAKILDEFSEAHDPHTPIGGTFIRAYATGAQAIRARGEKGEG
jgi:hypothetical protein